MAFGRPFSLSTRPSVAVLFRMPSSDPRSATPVQDSRLSLRRFPPHPHCRPHPKPSTPPDGVIRRDADSVSYGETLESGMIPADDCPTKSSRTVNPPPPPRGSDEGLKKDGLKSALRAFARPADSACARRAWKRPSSGRTFSILRQRPRNSSPDGVRRSLRA